MLIAVLSDTHDHLANLRSAVTLCNERGAFLLIHCGDLISPFMLQELAAFNGPVHLVYGNNIGDMYLISRFCADRFPSVTHHGIKGAIEAGGIFVLVFFLAWGDTTGERLISLAGGGVMIANHAWSGWDAWRSAKRINKGLAFHIDEKRALVSYNIPF